MLRHTVPGSSLSLCPASQSRNRGPNRLIGKGGRGFMLSAVTMGGYFNVFVIVACFNVSVRSCKILGGGGGFPYCKIM